MSLRSLFLKTNFRVIDSNSLSLAGTLRKLYRFVENLLYCETDNDTLQGRQFRWPYGGEKRLRFCLSCLETCTYHQVLALCALRPLFC